MPEIKINDYSGGWVPGEDPIQGRKNGLLQMDNVELDSNGALSLAGGTLVKQTGFSLNAHTLFSRLINGARHDYSLFTDGSCYRDATLLFAGGEANSNGAFGTAFNYTLVCCGSKRYKDSGAAVSGTNPVALGIAPASVKPTLAYSTANSPHTIIGNVSANIVAPAGLGTYTIPGATVILQMTANASGVWAIQTYGGTADPHNSNILTGVSSDVGYVTDNDYIQIVGYTPIVAGRSLNVDILLVAGNAAGDVVTDYYTYQIGDLSLVLLLGECVVKILLE
jgi:hypothetical protein